MDDEIEFNPKGRRLCPDGSCVGLIGPDGRCGECGRVAGPLASAGGGEPLRQPDEEDDGTGAAAEATSETPAEAAPRSGGGGEFDPARRLCDDGACVGVLDANRKCNVCGRMASS